MGFYGLIKIEIGESVVEGIHCFLKLTGFEVCGPGPEIAVALHGGGSVPFGGKPELTAGGFEISFCPVESSQLVCGLGGLAEGFMAGGGAEMGNGGVDLLPFPVDHAQDEMNLGDAGMFRMLLNEPFRLALGHIVQPVFVKSLDEDHPFVCAVGADRGGRERPENGEKKAGSSNRSNNHKVVIIIYET